MTKHTDSLMEWYLKNGANGPINGREAWPNLQPVIAWLENGCDPKEAAKELRIYDEAIRARGGK